MAFKLMDFRCEICGFIHEEMIDKREGDEFNDLCPDCKAPPEYQKPIIGNPKHFRHVSWGTFRA